MCSVEWRVWRVWSVNLEYGVWSDVCKMWSVGCKLLSVSVKCSRVWSVECTV